MNFKVLIIRRQHKMPSEYKPPKEVLTNVYKPYSEFYGMLGWGCLRCLKKADAISHYAYIEMY